jgi:hypothetical protein
MSFVDVELMSNIQRFCLSPSSGVCVVSIVLACYVYTQISRPSQLRPLGGRWAGKKRQHEEYIAEEWVEVKVMGKVEDILLWEEVLRLLPLIILVSQYESECVMVVRSSCLRQGPRNFHVLN